VLERGEGNAFAANGIGAVLAEQGHLGAARDIFTQVCGGAHLDPTLPHPVRLYHF
jgi:hypothetical protein